MFSDVVMKIINYMLTVLISFLYLCDFSGYTMHPKHLPTCLFTPQHGWTKHSLISFFGYIKTHVNNVFYTLNDLAWYSTATS